MGLLFREFSLQLETFTPVSQAFEPEEIAQMASPKLLHWV